MVEGFHEVSSGKTCFEVETDVGEFSGEFGLKNESGVYSASHRTQGSVALNIRSQPPNTDKFAWRPT